MGICLYNLCFLYFSALQVNNSTSALINSNPELESQMVETGTEQIQLVEMGSEQLQMVDSNTEQLHMMNSSTEHIPMIVDSGSQQTSLVDSSSEQIFTAADSDVIIDSTTQLIEFDSGDQTHSYQIISENEIQDGSQVYTLIPVPSNYVEQ